MQRIESVTSNNGAELLKLGFHNSFGKRNVLKFDLNYSKELLSERERKVILCRGAEYRKSAGTNS